MGKAKAKSLKLPPHSGRRCVYILKPEENKWKLLPLLKTVDSG